MPSRDMTIINKLGLHARAAAKLVTLASEYSAEIKVSRNGREVSGKSIMGIMMLAAAQGTSIHVVAEGDDAEAAIDAIQLLVDDRFGEDA